LDEKVGSDENTITIKEQSLIGSTTY